MDLEMEATYADGILKLDRPLPLEDNSRVRITIKVVAGRRKSGYGLIKWKGDPNKLEEFALAPPDFVPEDEA